MNSNLHHKAAIGNGESGPIRSLSVEVEMRLGQRHGWVLRAKNRNLVPVCDERGMRQAQK